MIQEYTGPLLSPLCYLIWIDAYKDNIGDGEVQRAWERIQNEAVLDKSIDYNK